MRSAHLIGIYGTTPIPKDLHYSDSFSAFAAFMLTNFQTFMAMD